MGISRGSIRDNEGNRGAQNSPGTSSPWVRGAIPLARSTASSTANRCEHEPSPATNVREAG